MALAHFVEVLDVSVCKLDFFIIIIIIILFFFSQNKHCF